VRCRLAEGDEMAAQPAAGEGERTSEIRRVEGGEALGTATWPPSAPFYFVGHERRGLI
jgi:hypothetical protein